jgi:hypothetical protein
MERVKKQTNKGGKKTRLIRGWNNEFQLVTMYANTIAYFFIITHDIKEDMKIDEPCTNLIETTLIVMGCCLNEKSTPPSIPTILPSSSVGVIGLRLRTLAKKPKS